MYSYIQKPSRLCMPLPAPVLLQRVAITTATVADTALPMVTDVLRSPGRPLDAATRANMEPRFGDDFSRVRVHTDDKASASARSVNALAYTVGNHVAFNSGQYRPHTDEGQRLIAHELAHVAQQGERQAAMPLRINQDAALEYQAENMSTTEQGQRIATPTTVAPGIQRAVSPEDVAVEMVGRQVTLTEAVGALAAGDTATVIIWSNASDTVHVMHPKLTTGPIAVPKRIIRPIFIPVAGLDPYSAGVEAQGQAVAKNKKQLADWMAKEPQYKSAKQKAAFAAEKTRIEGLLTSRQRTLNKKLIQETMFNRFDAIIKREVDTANKAHGLFGKDALDPNLLKSMLFQESEMGTSGAHLEVPPSHPVKTRFNIGQVIDSSANALLRLFEKEQPVIMTAYSLTTLRADLSAAQRERGDLQKKASRTAAENTRLAELDRLSAGSWETFIWQYKAVGAVKSFNDAVTDFFAGAAPVRNEDYGFWIHMAVLWLFEKRKTGMTWPEAIRAYNGSGQRARDYRDAVVHRAAGARSAAKARTAFIPGRT